MLWAAELRDETGRKFGGVRAGQVVHVIDDWIGEDGVEALVELRTPLRVRGRVRRDRLLVFTRRELSVEDGWSWWLARAPMWMIDGDRRRARISGAEAHGSVSAMPDVTVPCRELTGFPPPKLNEDGCHGAGHYPDTRLVGRSVAWDEPIVITGPAGQTVDGGHGEVGLVRREGDRVLVDVVDGTEWSRVRGWTNAAGMKTVPAGYGHGTAHLCCEGKLSIGGATTGDPLRLRRALDLRPTGTTAPVRLPAGTRVHEMARFESEVLVRHEGRWPGRAWTTLVITGWIRKEGLSSQPTLPAAFGGRLTLPARVTASSVRVAVRNGRDLLEGRVAQDGTFRIPGVPGHGQVVAWTDDRLWFGEGTASAGRDVVVALQRSRRARGQVLTADRLAIPHALVLNYGVGAPFDSKAWTDPDGWFHVLGPAGEEAASVYVNAPGFESLRVSVRGDDATIILPRRRLAAGLVGRSAAGGCRDREVLAESQRVIPVERDCSFAFGWDASGPVMFAGRHDRDLRVQLSPKLGRGTAGACVPAVNRGAFADLGGDRPDADTRCDVAADVSDLCLGPPCATPSRGSLFVRVATAAGQLAADASVTVRSGGEVVGQCAALSGACFVHNLPAGQAAIVEAQVRGASAAPSGASVKVKVGLTEVTLRPR